MVPQGWTRKLSPVHRPRPSRRGAGCIHFELHRNSMGPCWTWLQQIYPHWGLLSFTQWQVPRIDGRPGCILDSFPSNSPIITGGDFSAADIIWKSLTVAHGLNQGILCETLVSVFGCHHFKQLTKEPTWKESILDLYVTNRPGLFRSVETIPGYADHHTVVIDSDIKLRYSKNPGDQFTSGPMLRGTP